MLICILYKTAIFPDPFICIPVFVCNLSCLIFQLLKSQTKRKMYFKGLILLLSLLYLTSVESNDIMLGLATPYSKKIYSAVKIANPAIWRREDDVMVSTPNHEIISAVYITDLRPDKEGEAYIEAGGLGSKTVTIALKSPTILRGYKFAIEVYAQPLHPGYAPGILPGYPQARLSGNDLYPHTYNAGYPAGSIYPNSYGHIKK